MWGRFIYLRFKAFHGKWPRKLKKKHTTCGKGSALATTHKRIIHETKIQWIHRLEGRTRYRLAFHRQEVRLLFCTVYSPPRFIKDWDERRLHASPPRPVVQTSTVLVDAGSCPVGPPQKGVKWQWHRDMYSFHIVVFYVRLLTTCVMFSFGKPDCRVS
jgi:hypothetical protein